MPGPTRTRAFLRCLSLLARIQHPTALYLSRVTRTMETYIRHNHINIEIHLLHLLACGGYLQSMSTIFTFPTLDSTRYLASPLWPPSTAELPASNGSSSVAWRARSTCSRRSHLSAGMKYQLRMPKIVTAPRMTGACTDYKSGIISITPLRANLQS